jgi:hypothetical protein
VTFYTPTQIQAQILAAVEAGWKAWAQAGAPARVELRRGGEADILNCCNGYLGVGLDRIFPTEVFPIPAVEAPLPCARRRWGATFTVQHGQCCTAPVKAGLQPSWPSIEEVAADQEAFMRVAGAVLRALHELIGAWENSSASRAAVLGQWEPGEVNGTCLSGSVTLTVELDFPWAV